jgi:hypothetical protein
MQARILSALCLIPIAMPSLKVSKAVSRSVRVSAPSASPYSRTAQTQSAVQNQSTITRDRQKRQERMSHSLTGEHFIL